MRAGDDDRHQHAHGHRHFVADHLGRLAHAAEQRPLAAGAVAGQDDAEHFGGHDGQHEEDGDVQRPGHPAVGERQGQEGEEGAAEGDVGPQAEEHLVGVGGDEVFLDEQLDAVGDGLQPAELAADAGGAEAVLDAAGDLAFQPDEEDGGDGHESKQQQHRQQGGDPVGEVRRHAQQFRQVDHEQAPPPGRGSHRGTGLTGLTVWSGRRRGKQQVRRTALDRIRTGG